MLPYSRHTITDQDIEAVVECLKSGSLARGSYVARLEDVLKERAGYRYAVAFCNGTCALYAAIVAAEVGEVWSPSLTFGAVANATLLAHRQLQLVDTQPDTMLANFYGAKDDGDCAWVPMDYAGYPHPIGNSGEDPEDALVIRDACHSFGNNGSNNDGMQVVSFHPAKIVTSGEGGAVFTNDGFLYQALVSIRDNGRVMGEHVTLGLNYHMPEMCAALVLSQLERLPKNLKRRREIAGIYRRHWENDTRLILQPDHPEHAYHLFVIRLSKEARCSRESFRERLARECQVGSQIHYRPIHKHPAFTGEFSDVDWSNMVNTDDAYERMVSIPLFPAMSDEQVVHVIESIDAILGYS